MATIAKLDFTVSPLPATFGAVVTGIRLPELSEARFRALHAIWLDYGVLIFPGQHLTGEEQNIFARRFGALEYETGALTNVDEQGEVRAPDAGKDDVIKMLKGNMGWHQDSTYMPVQAKGAVLSAEIVPSEGGGTSFADMEAAHAALSPAEQEEIASLSAAHSIVYSQARLGFHHDLNAVYSYGMHGASDPRRPLVKTHPETGRKSLAIGRHAHAVTGLDEAASEALVARLIEGACQPPRVWTHIWAPGDAIIWDNRRILHRGEPWDMREARTMWHARIAGDASEAAL